MVTKKIIGVICIIYICSSPFLPHTEGAFGFQNKDKILLTDVNTLTLKSGEMTNGRRSPPVPQLKCVGGSAANAFTPQVVQCYNRGTDGYDVQWECKTDMDNAYRFGKIQVTCEGYDHRDDPYILKGSCGLEYTLDFTKEGYEQQHQGRQHNYYGNQGHQQPYYNSYNSYSSSIKGKAGSVMSDLIALGVAAFIIYVIYKSCIASSAHQTTYQPHSTAPPPYPNQPPPPYSSQPPPPGFRNEYTQPGCSSSYDHSSTYTNARTGTGGGFWSGAFTGGILGYMFGNRNNYSPYNTGWGWNRGWGWSSGRTHHSSPGWFSSGSSNSGWSHSSGSSSRSSSSGTRTASGFGGTSRR